MGYSARKPYTKLKMSLKDFFTAPVRHLKDTITKESQFEKPYLESSYPEMHLDIPYPDWPDWEFNVPPLYQRRWTPPSGGAIPAVGPCGPCGLYVDPLPFNDCKKYPVEVHAGIFCTNDFRLLGFSDCTLEISMAEGKALKITEGMWRAIGPSKAVWVDPSVGFHVVIGKLTDGAGNVCYGSVEVDCYCAYGDSVEPYASKSVAGTWCTWSYYGRESQMADSMEGFFSRKGCNGKNAADDELCASLNVFVYPSTNRMCWTWTGDCGTNCTGNPATTGVAYTVDCDFDDDYSIDADWCYCDH